MTAVGAPYWIDRRALLLLHDESLALFGGAPGIRDEALLDSALARPLNRLHYESPDLAELAACYGYGIARNHPFIDGNKRTAFLALGLFLQLNGRSLKAPADEATATMLSVAAGTLDEQALAAWTRHRS